MTRLSLSLLVRIRGNETAIARYRLSIDPPTLSFPRNNGRINSPEARDRSYRDHSEIEMEQRQKKEEGETNPEPILFFPSSRRNAKFYGEI